MIAIKHIEINQIMTLNNPLGVDMPSLKPNIDSYECNKTFSNESNFGIK